MNTITDILNNMSKNIKTGKKAEKKAMQEKARKDSDGCYPASKKKLKDASAAAPEPFNSTIHF